MYKYIKILEENHLFKELVKQGIISITLEGYKSIYEDFLKEKAKGIGTSQAVTNTAINTKTAESTIYKIIRKMKN